MNLNAALSLVYNQLNAVAQSPDYWTIFDTVFGSNYNSTLATTLQQQWQTGDFGALPTIEILSSEVLGNASGAYATSTNTIYLADTFVATATPEALSAVILEEIGHFVDAQINTVDTQGDEGALFSDLVRGVTLTATELSQIQSENDQAVITIEGQQVAIEQAANVYTEKTGTANPFNGVNVGGNAAPFLMDLDGDRDLDLIVGRLDGTLSYYKNTGTKTAPIYTLQTGTANPFNGFDVGSNSTVAFQSIDTDTDYDLIVGNSVGVLSYYKNTGNNSAPVFTAQTSTANPFNGFDVGGYSAPYIADLDFNSVRDVVVGEDGGLLNYYKNTGSPSAPAFTLQTGTANPFNSINFGTLIHTTPILIDFDLDGDFDLILGLSTGVLYYYKNTGSKTAPAFTVQTGTANPFNVIDMGADSVPTAQDVDDDGDLDLIVGTSGGTIRYFMSVPNSASPTITSGATANFVENGTGVAYTATATDPDAGNILGYSISGTDAALFNINSITGAVTFKTTPNFEAPSDSGANNVYNLNVTVSDGSLTATKAVAITVTNVNEVPTLTSGATASLAENGTGIAYTVTATDPDAGATLTYSISGTDAALFNINSSTGAITFKTAPNFEVPSDSGANNVYDLTVAASDGSLSATKAVAITVTNVNEFAPTITSGATASFAENGTGTAYTVTATDPDAGTALSYSISGTDVALFNINSSTGAITFKTTPNFETPADNGANNVYNLNVTVSDGSLTATKAVAITVTNVNEFAPTITSGATVSFA